MSEELKPCPFCGGEAKHDAAVAQTDKPEILEEVMTAINLAEDVIRRYEKLVAKTQKMITNNKEGE